MLKRLFSLFLSTAVFLVSGLSGTYINTVMAKEESVSYWTEDFEGYDNKFSVISSRDYFWQADSAEQNAADGLIYGVGSRSGGSTAALSEKINSSKYTENIIELDFRLDACTANAASYISLLGNKCTSESLNEALAGQIVTVKAATGGSNGKWSTITVNGKDIKTAANLTDGKENGSNLKRDTTGWIHLSVKPDFEKQTAEIVLTRKSNGTVIYSGETDFVNQSSDFEYIYISGGKTYGAAWIDNVKVSGVYNSNNEPEATPSHPAPATIAPLPEREDIYDMHTEDLENPMGIDEETPAFSWKQSSENRGVMQTGYRVTVAKDEALSDIVWDSGEVNSDVSVDVRYGGTALEPRTRYYWNVTVTDNDGSHHSGTVQWFETGLMGVNSSVWNGAQWIGSPDTTVNADSSATFKIETDFKLGDGTSSAGFVVNARNKDNYVLADVNLDTRLVKLYYYCDNAWDNAVPAVTALGNADGYYISTDAVAEGAEHDEHSIAISEDNRNLVISINGTEIVNEEKVIPANETNKPRRERMMQFGFKQNSGSVSYDNMTVTETHQNLVFQSDSFDNDNGALSSLGTVRDGKLVVENEFRLTNAVPGVNVRKSFNVSGEIKSARLYSSARGFYNAYLNGNLVNNDFLNPGYTDYNMRVQYQTYDITDMLRQGENTIGATVSKGYYSGYVGNRNEAMLYGKQNSFIGQIVIDYADGTTDTIVTDSTWQFTDKGPLINGDNMQGEMYDARLEFDWNDANDGRWKSCGVLSWPGNVKGVFTPKQNVATFELSAQQGPAQQIERILTPVSEPYENPEGHFVYDLGQNMAGIIRFNAKGANGQSIKIRYGEMCYSGGRIFFENLRNAANTDIYTFKGDENGETHTTYFTAHGFRYVEISGDGYTLTREQLESMDIQIEGLVLTNTPDETGAFECSNDNINQLQSNIQWGQRDNSLMVYTDCPQRDERLGWLGDAQVFSTTAAYNMNIKAFMNKWLQDLRDSQKRFNKYGCMPDVAPLNETYASNNGCDGWGDAAAIIPWNMYTAYGDIKILEDNYDLMKGWVDYQSRDDRQNYGLRTVGGKEVPDKSDLAENPYIQVQQTRGDWLSYDDSTPYILTATAYAAHSAELVSKAASVLGKTEDEEKYRERFENIKQAFNDAWVKEDGSLAYWGEMSSTEKHAGNRVCDTYYSENGNEMTRPSQTAYAVAIDFGLIPDDKLSGTYEYMRQSVERNDNKLSVGFLGISHLEPALTKANCKDLAFTLLEQDENPSWLYSVVNGATTIWERWNSYVAETDSFDPSGMNSFNHYSYGSVGEWMFSDILGIVCSEPGFKKIELRPSAGGSLTYANGYYSSAYGDIVSGWSCENDEFTYKCTVPANTTATLYLPTEDGKVIKEGGINAENAEWVTYKGIQGDEAVFELASGSYSFTVKEKGDEPEPTPTVPAEEPTPCIKITAVYNDNGSLHGVTIEEAASDEAIPYEEGNTKVMYWTSLEEMKPVSAKS